MTKTEFMLIASRQKLSQFTESPSLTINENAIEQVTSAKSLGVYVDQNINWECHIENISKKIACAIKRIWHLTPFNILIKVYNSLIQPQFGGGSGKLVSSAVRRSWAIVETQKIFENGGEANVR